MCVAGGVKEPRHLQYMADLEDLNAYSVVNSRKLYGAPADFTFCIKVTSASGAVEHLPTGQTLRTVCPRMFAYICV